MSTVYKNPDNIQTVDVNRHRKLKVKSNPGFDHARDHHVVAINLSELAESASNFPIVFLPREGDGRYLIAAMMGLRDGENVYYGPQFWQSTYVPLAIRRHPFSIGYDDRLPNGEEITTCIDMSSAYISETQGTALFNDDGSQSEFLKANHGLMGFIFEGQKITDAFVAKLMELGLLVPMEIQLRLQDGSVRKIGGVTALDERKVKALTIEQLRELHDSDFLPAAYIIAGSLHQLTRLIRMRNQQGNREQIVDYRLEFDPPPPAQA